jgi:hypothetical protein
MESTAVLKNTPAFPEPNCEQKQAQTLIMSEDKHEQWIWLMLTGTSHAFKVDLKVARAGPSGRRITDVIDLCRYIKPIFDEFRHVQAGKIVIKHYQTFEIFSYGTALSKLAGNTENTPHLVQLRELCNVSTSYN